MALTEVQTKRLTSFKTWMAKRQIVAVMPVVRQVRDGRFACMVGARDQYGEYNLVHFGFCKSKALCEKIATEQANELGA